METQLTALECESLKMCEEVINRGLNTFYEVGRALMQIRDQRLYRQMYGTFEDYCQRRWQMPRQHINRLIGAAKTYDVLEPIGSKIPENEAQVRPLTQLAPEEQRIVWDVVQKTAPDGKVSAAHVKSVTDVFKTALKTGAVDPGTGEEIPIEQANAFHWIQAVGEETYERVMRQQLHIKEKNGNGKLAPHQLIQQSISNEWYTPQEYLDAVHEVMGGVDVDPASNDMANQIVKAFTYYTIETNGFDKEWRGRVFLNPPYGKENGDSNQELWSARLLDQYSKGITTEAILLVNAVTDRKWFQPLWCYTICFTDHRIQFYDPSGEPGQPTHGNAFIYLGDHSDRFTEVFKRFGAIVRRIA